jgi:hypothetical protein
MLQPYFKGQKSSCPHGCYYPDISRLRDERRNNKIIRISYCIRHGYIESNLDTTNMSKEDIKKVLSCPRRMPTEYWRESERIRLRSE